MYVCSWTRYFVSFSSFCEACFVSIVGYRNPVLHDRHRLTASAWVKPNSVCLNTVAADALNAIFNKWTQRTPQLKTILNWSHDRHPCNSTIVEYYNPVRFEGAWRGVYCTAFFRLRNTTGDYYEVAVTTLMWVTTFCETWCAVQLLFLSVIGKKTEMNF